jgi:REP element-mobilizing transposase RayT
VVDRELVGHRGAPIGTVEAVVAQGGGQARLRFHTRRPLERHDGLQIDIPGGGKPFGFPIDVLRVGGKNVITAPAASAVEVELPRARPQIPLGARLYCSSSQAVKRSYPFARPKPGTHKVRQPISIRCTLAPDGIRAEADTGRRPVPLSAGTAQRGTGVSPVENPKKGPHEEVTGQRPVSLSSGTDECGTGVPPVQPEPWPAQVFKPYNQEAETSRLRRNLPHWRQTDATYFVTFRTADALPVQRLKELSEEREIWLRNNPEPWREEQVRTYQHRFVERLQNWLDEGAGACALRDQRLQDEVEKALRFFDTQRYVLDEFIIMPNHVHVLVKPLGDQSLTAILHSWKSFTAHSINKFLDTTGTFWMDESFDHAVRSWTQLEFFRDYIRKNATHARLSSFHARQGTGKTPLVCASDLADTGRRPVPLSTGTAQRGTGVPPVREGAQISIPDVFAPANTGQRPVQEGSPVSVSMAAVLAPAKDVARMAAAARGAFEKLGDTAFELASFTLENPHGLFAPVSLLNELRRKLCVELERAVAQQTTERLRRIGMEMESEPPAPAHGTTEERWLIQVDRPAYLEAFTAEDWRTVEEVTLAAEIEPLPQLLAALERLAEVVGRERIRLALPIITRRWEEKDLLQRIHALRAAGWHKWAAANISAWAFLRENEKLDLAADWPLYTLNTAAAAQLLDMGATRVTLSPEDGLDNFRPLLQRLGARAVVVVYQDTPLFISEACPEAAMTGGCAGPSQCRFAQVELVSDAGEQVISVNRRCRTYTLNRHPLCLATRLAALRQAGARRLRADFCYRPYTADEVARRWREVRAGRTLPGTHIGNFDRGLL